MWFSQHHKRTGESIFHHRTERTCPSLMANPSRTAPAGGPTALRREGTDAHLHTHHSHARAACGDRSVVMCACSSRQLAKLFVQCFGSKPCTPAPPLSLQASAPPFNDMHGLCHLCVVGFIPTCLLASLPDGLSGPNVTSAISFFHALSAPCAWTARIYSVVALPWTGHLLHPRDGPFLLLRSVKVVLLRVSVDFTGRSPRSPTSLSASTSPRVCRRCVK
jgi:hypothetical protein